MDRNKPLVAFCFTAIVLSACAEGEGPEASPDGLYEVSVHTRTQGSCDGEGQDVEGAPGHFRLLETDFGTDRILTWHECESVDTCDDSSTAMFDYENGEWVRQWSSTVGVNDAFCSVETITGTLEQTDDGIRVEFRTASGTLEIPCEDGIAETHADELSCDNIEVYEGILL